MPNNQNVFIRPELEVYIQNTSEKMRVSARKCMKSAVFKTSREADARTAAPASPGRIIRSALSLLISSAPFARANPSSDDFRRPRGVSGMPGDVPDPASWVAGATKSELERLLVFLDYISLGDELGALTGDD